MDNKKLVSSLSFQLVSQSFLTTDPALPPEIWITIFKYLSLKDRLNLRPVCRLFYRLATVLTEHLVVAVCCALPPVEFLYSNQCNSKNSSNKSFKNFDILQTWNVDNCLSTLSILCPRLQTLKLAFLANIPGLKTLDISLLPSIRSLEISSGYIELINPNNVQLSNCQHLVLLKTNAKDLLHMFPNVISCKFDFFVTNNVVNESIDFYSCSSIRKLTLIRFDQYYNLESDTIVFQNVERLIVENLLEFHIPDGKLFANVKRVDFVIQNLLEPFKQETERYLSYTLNQINQNFYQNLDKVQIFINGLRQFVNSPKRIAETAKLINTPSSSVLVNRLPVNCDHQLCKKVLIKKLNTLHYPQPSSSNHSTQASLQELIVTRMPVHSLILETIVQQSTLDLVPQLCPDLIRFRFLGSFVRPDQQSLNFEYDFSFLLKLKSLQQLVLDAVRIKDANIIVQAISSLAYLNDVSLTFIDLDRKAIDKLQTIMEKKQIQHPSNQYVLWMGKCG